MDGEVTRLLGQLQNGREGAEAKLYGLVYDELRRIAGRCMRSQPDNHTLQPTALVHEAYLKLLGGAESGFTDRAHFLNAAARAMRCILVDHARARRALKRGGGSTHVTFNEDLHGDTESVEKVIAVHDALEKLEQVDPQKGRLVELRYFGGLPFDEIAKVMALPERTMYRLWDRARAWLFAEMAG